MNSNICRYLKLEIASAIPDSNNENTNKQIKQQKGANVFHNYNLGRWNGQCSFQLETISNSNEIVNANDIYNVVARLRLLISIEPTHHPTKDVTSLSTHILFNIPVYHYLHFRSETLARGVKISPDTRQGGCT